MPWWVRSRLMPCSISWITCTQETRERRGERGRGQVSKGKRALFPGGRHSSKKTEGGGEFTTKQGSYGFPTSAGKQETTKAKTKTCSITGLQPRQKRQQTRSAVLASTVMGSTLTRPEQEKYPQTDKACSPR